MSTRALARGRYENVFLTEAEIAELQADFPSVWQECIERLSEYMASTGKTYKSHAATIRRWVKEDKRKGKGVSDYRGLRKNLNRLHVLFASANLHMLARAGGSLCPAQDFCAI